MRTRLFKKVAAIIGAGIMTVGLLAPMSVWAGGMPNTNPTGADVTAGAHLDGSPARTSVTLHKFIQADPDASIPAKDFTFSITPLGIGSGSDTTDMPKLTIGNASTSSAQNTTEAGATYQDGKAHANTVEATTPVTLELKYGTGSNLDTSKTDGIQWPYAGVYRYFVTETNGATDYWKYMTDGNTGYEICVYVENNTDDTTKATIPLVTSYVIVNKATVSGNVSDATVTPGVKVDASDESTENLDGDGFEFTNRYDPVTDLSISKTITGNAANMKKEFSYTLSDLKLPDEKFSDATTFTATTTDTAPVLSTNNETSVTVGAAFTFKLGHGDTLSVANLPVGTTYKITENGETNYTASVEITEAGAKITPVSTSGEGISSISGNTAKGTVASSLGYSATIKATSARALNENKVDFTNDYTVTTPTGIILSNLPAFAAIFCALGLAVFALIARRKRSR